MAPRRGDARAARDLGGPPRCDARAVAAFVPDRSQTRMDLLARLAAGRRRATPYLGDPERPRGQGACPEATTPPASTPAARSWSHAGSPPDRCQPWKRWLGKSLRPLGRGRRTTCSRSGAEAAAAPSVAGSSTPRRNATRSNSATPLRSSNRRDGMSRCGIRSPTASLSSPSATAARRDGAAAPTAAPLATCRLTIIAACGSGQPSARARRAPGTGCAGARFGSRSESPRFPATISML